MNWTHAHPHFSFFHHERYPLMTQQDQPLLLNCLVLGEGLTLNAAILGMAVRSGENEMISEFKKRIQNDVRNELGLNLFQLELYNANNLKDTSEDLAGLIAPKILPTLKTKYCNGTTQLLPSRGILNYFSPPHLPEDKAIQILILGKHRP